jgi:plastocyanin
MNRVRSKLALGVFMLLFCAPVLSAEKNLEGQITVPPNIRPIDLVVYVANPPQARVTDNPLRTVVMDQRNQTYFPRVLPILKGTTVKFQNSDRVTHNVFSLSPVKAFDLGKITPNEFKNVIFDKPGIVEILCGFHSRMLAYIRVMEHPYFAVPDAQGKFIIKDITPGTYELRIWHESIGGTERVFTVTVDQRMPIQIDFLR